MCAEFQPGRKDPLKPLEWFQHNRFNRYDDKLKNNVNINSLNGNNMGEKKGVRVVASLNEDVDNRGVT